MRAGRLLELLLRLQLRGGAPASELAAALEVSVRTIYRDVEALGAAGVPVWTETGRGGGVRIDPSYRVAGLPRLDEAEARGLLFAVVPAIAAQLGLDDSAADRTLLPALERSAGRAAQVVRDRLLVEPSHWFVPDEGGVVLARLADAVWSSRAVRLTYRGSGLAVHPYGLVLKGSTWYAVGRTRPDDGRGVRLFRLSRVSDVTLTDHVFTRPDDFDLAAAWATAREAFVASLPRYEVALRVAPWAETDLALLDEASPDLPLPVDVERDQDGWAHLRLTFERGTLGTARHLLRLGGGVEVLGPPDLRAHLADEARRLAARYGVATTCPKIPSGGSTGQ